MNGEKLWRKIISQLPVDGEEMKTTEGLWFLVSASTDMIVVTKAIYNKPSSRLNKERNITQEEFLEIYPYYEQWIKDIPYTWQKAKKKSHNVSYIFPLIEKYINN